MITMDQNLQSIHHQALQRQARQRVDRLDELRAAKNAADRNLTQREIAELLATSQTQVHRLLQALERRGGAIEQDPEEIILRAFAYDSSHEEMVEALKVFPYTFGEEAPYPEEGRLPGTWDQVVSAYAQGMLREDDFEEVSAAIDR